jgi:EpsI family protein
MLLLLTSSYIYIHKDIEIAVNKPFSTFPGQIGDWRMIGETFMSDPVLEKLKPTDYLFRSYQAKSGERVTLYIGFHGGGKDTGEIHSPKHCLPGSGWYEVYSRKTSLPNVTGTINLVESLYQKGENRELFLYWFQVKGVSLNNEYSLKLAEIKNSALYRRRDAAFIRISVPFTHDEAGAMKVGASFIKDLSPVINAYLPN